MFATQGPSFHDYPLSQAGAGQLAQLSSLTLDISQVPGQDVDIQTIVSSPSTLYEPDTSEAGLTAQCPRKPGQLLSPCGSNRSESTQSPRTGNEFTFDLTAAGQDNEDFQKIDLDKLYPQPLDSESFSNLISNTVGSRSASPFSKTLLDDYLSNKPPSTEGDKGLQNVLKDVHSLRGPTLAQLNNDNAHLDRSEAVVGMSQSVGLTSVVPVVSVPSWPAAVSLCPTICPTSNPDVVACATIVTSLSPAIQPQPIAPIASATVFKSGQSSNSGSPNLQRLLAGSPNMASATPNITNRLPSPVPSPTPTLPGPQPVFVMSTTQHAPPSATAVKSESEGTKRRLPSPDSNSMELKWQEIRSIIDSNIKSPESESLVEPDLHCLPGPAKRIKIEPQGRTKICIVLLLLLCYLQVSSFLTKENQRYNK